MIRNASYCGGGVPAGQLRARAAATAPRPRPRPPHTAAASPVAALAANSAHSPPHHRAASHQHHEHPKQQQQQLLSHLRVLAPWAVTAALAFAPPNAAAALAPLVITTQEPAEVSVRFPASPDPEIRAAQERLVQAWAYTDGLFIDQTFNGLGAAGFKRRLEEALAASFRARDAAAVDASLAALLSELGDEYTRALPPRAASALRAEGAGRVVSAGAVLRPDAASGGLLRVAAVVEGSPAARAGVRVGDVLLAINGAELAPGAPPGEAYRLLQEEADLKLRRGGSGSASSSSSSKSGGRILTVHVTPAEIEFEPVQYALLSTNGSSSGDDGGGGGPRAVGYVRIVSFASTTAERLDAALRALQRQAAAATGDSSSSTSSSTSTSSSSSSTNSSGALSALIIDLRGNPGGDVRAGVEAARDLMSDGAALATVAGRGGARERVPLTGAHPLVSPAARVVVLVDGRTASTAELLAGALRDARGAALLGDAPATFGKGLTQRVVALNGGYTLMVSTLRLMTPAGTEFHGTGLKPDAACAPPMAATTTAATSAAAAPDRAAPLQLTAAAAAAEAAGGGERRGAALAPAALAGDACISAALERLAADTPRRP